MVATSHQEHSKAQYEGLFSRPGSVFWEFIYFTEWPGRGFLFGGVISPVRVILFV